MAETVQVSAALAASERGDPTLSIVSMTGKIALSLSRILARDAIAQLRGGMRDDTSYGTLYFTDRGARPSSALFLVEDDRSGSSRGGERSTLESICRWTPPQPAEQTLLI